MLDGQIVQLGENFDDGCSAKMSLNVNMGLRFNQSRYIIYCEQKYQMLQSYQSKPNHKTKDGNN